MSQPDGDAERSELLRLIAARPAGGSLRPPVLVSARPIRPFSPELSGLCTRRQAGGLSPTGSEYPRRERWQVTVMPAIVIGLVATIVAVVAASISHSTLALGALIVLLVCVVLGTVAARWLLADPLRLGRAERLEVLAAGNWQSSQDWVPPFSGGAERALIGYAVEAAQAIASDPARASSSLAAELDQLDGQAHQLAVARAAQPGDPAVEQAWSGLVDRVVALRTSRTVSMSKHPEESS